MKYLLTQTKDGYFEYPVPENVKKYKENIWLFRDGRQIFLLGGEEHIFKRRACVTISPGREALLQVHGLKSRFYIKGMQLFAKGGNTAMNNPLFFPFSSFGSSIKNLSSDGRLRSLGERL